MTLIDYSQFPFFRKIVEIERSPSLAAILQLDSNVTERAVSGFPNRPPPFKDSSSKIQSRWPPVALVLDDLAEK